MTDRAARNPLVGWQVPRDDIRYIGTGLRRPECVLATPDGSLMGRRLPVFRSPVAGLPLPHWT
jgi:hypothetical protein